jgi:hypothetical protein
MTTVHEIEKAISSLAPEQLAEFRAWFAEFVARLFDGEIGRDIEAGKLDRLAAEELAELEAGRARELY